MLTDAVVIVGSFAQTGCLIALDASNETIHCSTGLCQNGFRLRVGQIDNSFQDLGRHFEKHGGCLVGPPEFYYIARLRN